MKTLELSLQKRLVILELDESLETLNIFSWNNQPLGKICKGSELTEEIAEGLVEESKYINYDGESGWIDYKVYPDGLILNPLKSFISAIEANGYYWGENPLGEEPIYVDLGNYKVINEPEEFERQKAYSRTFKPEKTLIFEIVII